MIENKDLRFYVYNPGFTRPLVAECGNSAGPAFISGVKDGWSPSQIQLGSSKELGPARQTAGLVGQVGLLSTCIRTTPRLRRSSELLCVFGHAELGLASNRAVS